MRAADVADPRQPLPAEVEALEIQVLSDRAWLNCCTDLSPATRRDLVGLHQARAALAREKCRLLDELLRMRTGTENALPS